MGKLVRVGSANTGSALRRELDAGYRGRPPAGALEQVGRVLDALEGVVHKAGEAGCDVVAFPEDTLVLNKWQAANWEVVGEVLPEAVASMLDRLGRAAATHNMHLMCCSDTFEPGGAVLNTAFFLGSDGREIGRYSKVGLPVFEQLKTHGDGFPVFQTPEMGGVGMLICYDMVFPEAARCLALGGADIIFHLTLGGAALGGHACSQAAFLTRAAENFTYVVVSWGAWGDETGSMIISPKGEMLAEEKRPGELAIADIDPFGGRQATGWSNYQEDMRARLFRERRPEVYGVLTDPHPPALDKLADFTPASEKEIAHIVMRAKTEGQGRFDEAEGFLRERQIDRAIDAFERIKADFAGTWFDRAARERLAVLQSKGGRP